MKNPCLVLVGSHASGKSTLGQLISARLGWRFDRELGEKLRRESLARDPEAHAQQSLPDFDRAVIRGELERDDALVDQGPRVVETWHPGNLSYASVRCPEVARALLPEVSESVAVWRSRVIVQPLHIDRQELARRIHEPGPDDPFFADWLWSVGLEAERWARTFELLTLPPIQTSSSPPDECVLEILRRLESHCDDLRRPELYNEADLARASDPPKGVLRAPPHHRPFLA